MNKVAVVGLLASVVGCKNRESSGSAGTSSSAATESAPMSLSAATPSGIVDAVTLTAEFDNQVRASQVYSGRTYDIKGTLVYAKDSGDLGLGPHLVLKGAKYVDVACQLEARDLGAVAELPPRADVTIRGVITGKTDGRFLYVKPCIVAPPQSPEETERAELAKLSVKDVTLVDASGTVLKDSRGQPITKHLADCDSLKDEKRVRCQDIFFAAHECQRDTADEASRASCTHKAIATWIVKQNSDALDAKDAVIVVNEVTLAGQDGKPLMVEGKPLVGADGKPLTKKLSSCSSLSAGDQYDCEVLFIDVSNCKINPPDEGVAECGAEKLRDWVEDHPREATRR